VSCVQSAYAYAWEYIAHGFKWLINWLTQWAGNELVAISLVVLAGLPLAALFAYVTKIVVPKFAEWYYEETITRRALHYYQGCVGLGFKKSTAVVSVATGVAFCFLVRIAAAVPLRYAPYTVSCLIIAFMGVSVLGFFVSGRVPAGDRARRRYWKRFQSPTITGLLVGVGTLVSDFIVNTMSVFISWL